MNLPNNYQIIEKNVKHARIRVSNDGSVRIIVPQGFLQQDLTTLLQKKQSWIEKHQAFFRNQTKINLQRNQLLLYGDRYHYFYESSSPQVTINYLHKTIQSSLNLLEQTIQESWYKSIAKPYLTRRTQELAQNFNFQYHKIFIRSQRTKFGSCSSLKNISLNWRLIKAPKFVIDYVIIHELCHTKIMNHSSKFWLLLRSLYPDYQDAVEWLKKYGHNL